MLGAVPRGLVHSHLLTVRSHVSGEMVALPEILMANGACDSILPQLLRMQVRPHMLFFVVGTHVEDQVRGQVKGEVALRTPVLGRWAQGSERGWQEGPRGSGGGGGGHGHLGPGML